MAKGIERMFRNSVFMEFIVFVAFYVLAKALFHVLNIEARRAGNKTVAGVAGLLA